VCCRQLLLQLGEQQIVYERPGDCPESAVDKQSNHQVLMALLSAVALTTNPGQVGSSCPLHLHCRAHYFHLQQQHRQAPGAATSGTGVESTAGRECGYMQQMQTTAAASAAAPGSSGASTNDFLSDMQSALEALGYDLRSPQIHDAISIRL